MTIIVERAAGLATVQDAGRHGWRACGVVSGGAVDSLALATANLLVGNDADAAALECTLVGPTLGVERDVTIALTGADLGLRIDGVAHPAWRAIDVAAGARIDFAGRRCGCRGIVAVAGGIDVPAVLGSRSTDLTAGFGGVEGRTLRAGDRLPIGPRRPAWPGGGRAVAGALRSHGGGAVRVVRGPEADRFAPAAWDTFLSARYAVGAASDRMGCRLEGPPLESAAPGDMLSQGVVPGTVQVPPDGRPIVLMADAPVTGGYPRIGVVIGADLPIVAQTMPGETLTFRTVTLDEARAAWRRRARALARLRIGLALGGGP
ncbi:MAG: biotin-dependent carboxyltransferase family protein [Planctomycetaceae bacterium]